MAVKLYYLSGFSATGKTTICKAMNDANIEEVVVKTYEETSLPQFPPPPPSTKWKKH